MSVEDAAMNPPMGAQPLMACLKKREDLGYRKTVKIRPHKELPLSPVTSAVVDAVREKAPFMAEDHYISPDMEWSRELVHSGRVREIAESAIGRMY